MPDHEVLASPKQILENQNTIRADQILKKQERMALLQI